MQKSFLMNSDTVNMSSELINAWNSWVLMACNGLHVVFTRNGTEYRNAFDKDKTLIKYLLIKEI